MRICAIGTGSFGTTMMVVLGHALLSRKDTTLINCYVRRSELLQHLTEHRHHPDYSELRTVHIPPNIQFVSTLDHALADATHIIIAVPSRFIRHTLKGMGGKVGRNVKVLSLTKGLYVDEVGTPFRRMSELIGQELQIPSANICSMGGPNTFKEIASNFDKNAPKHEACNAGFSSESIETAEEFQRLFFLQDVLRTYRSKSIKACELCGALKNVYAIAVGIGDGTKLGVNFKASLIARSMYEVSKLVERLGDPPIAAFGLAGLGDLVATALAGRSRSAGEYIAQGYTVEEVRSKMHRYEIEGFQTLHVMRSWLGTEKLRVKDDPFEMPILEATCEIVFDGVPVRDAICKVINRRFATEFRFFDSAPGG